VAKTIAAFGGGVCRFVIQFGVDALQHVGGEPTPSSCTCSKTRSVFFVRRAPYVPELALALETVIERVFNQRLQDEFEYGYFFARARPRKFDSPMSRGSAFFEWWIARAARFPPTVIQSRLLAQTDAKEIRERADNAE